MADDLLKINEKQESLPDIDSSERFLSKALGSDVSSSQLAAIYGWDIRSIQRWDQEGIIQRNNNGRFVLGEVIYKIDHWRVNTINRRPSETPEGQESANDAKRRREIAEATIKELELSEKRRDLLSRIEVERTAFEMARQLREAFENIPSRIGDMCAAENNPVIVKKLLGAEINRVLELLSND